MDDGMLWAVCALAIAAMLGIDLAFGASGLLLRRRCLRREARAMRPLLEALHAASGAQPQSHGPRREALGAPGRGAAGGLPAAPRLSLIQGGQGNGRRRWAGGEDLLAAPAQDRSAPAAAADAGAGQWRMAARR